MQGLAYVGDKLVAEAILSCALVDRSRLATAPAEEDGSR
jgi:hypothetical protein